jgi:hypothetical protein
VRDISAHWRQTVQLFYLVESSPEASNKAMCASAFGIEYDSLEVHGSVFAPVDRHSFFTSNIYHKQLGKIKDIDDSTTVGACIEDDYHHAGNIARVEAVVKVPAFSANPQEINDERMLVFINNAMIRNDNNSNIVEGNIDGRVVRSNDDISSTADISSNADISSSADLMTSSLMYTGRYLTLSERESMVGLPAGYVSTSVEWLFTELVQKGFLPECASERWQDVLDSKLHCFAGAYHNVPDGYKLFCDKTAAANDPSNVIKLKMRPFETLHYFAGHEEYGKYLVAQSSIIPVLELLLEPLMNLYGKRVYQTFKYSYKWHAA